MNSAQPQPEPAPDPRQPTSQRAMLASIIATLADTLDESIEGAKAQLLDLQGFERVECETYLTTATGLVKGMRKHQQALEQEPSRIVAPGKHNGARKQFVRLDDAQALQMLGKRG